MNHHRSAREDDTSISQKRTATKALPVVSNQSGQQPKQQERMNQHRSA
jgi:hypothetical protein